MIRKFLLGVTVCVCLEAAWLFGEEMPAKIQIQEPGEEEKKVIAMMDLLEVMDLAENLEMIRDLDLLIEEKKDENEN